MSAVPKMTIDEIAGAMPTVRLIRGDQIKLAPRRWLWEGFLPAGLMTILGGAPGCGKTTISLSLAATVTRGGLWPDGTRYGERGDVLVFSAEDDHQEIASRLRAAGADMTRVHIIAGVATQNGEDAFDPARDMGLLEAAVARLEAARLLIVDPIVQAVSGDGHKSNDVRRGLQPLVDLAQRVQCAVVGITHFSKGTSGREPVERITGSLAYGALARVVLVAAEHKVDSSDGEGASHVLVRAKSNIGPSDGGFSYDLEQPEIEPGITGQRVRWREAVQGSAREVLADAEGDADEDGDSRSDVEAFIHAMLDDGPVPARRFQADSEGAGYCWRTVQRHAKRVGASAQKLGMQAGWQWGFFGLTKASTRAEDVEDASIQSLTPSAPSVPAVTPSDGMGDDDDGEVL
jgi:putative DNA primase/helicase